MVCIYCSGKTRVSNSRSQKRSNSTWRRRTCRGCGAVFSTVEEADLGRSLVFRKGTAIEPFSRDLILLSVYDSLKHRKTSVRDAEGLTRTIIGQLLTQVITPELNREDIVNTTTKVLKRFDKAAATHYVAFHPLKIEH